MIIQSITLKRNKNTTKKLNYVQQKTGIYRG